MEIMNYSEMLENANAVKILVNKTIECSKDYTDLRKDDIIEQMINYIYHTFKSAMELNMVTKEFILEVDKYLRGNLWFTMAHLEVLDEEHNYKYTLADLILLLDIL